MSFAIGLSIVKVLEFILGEITLEILHLLAIIKFQNFKFILGIRDPKLAKRGEVIDKIIQPQNRGKFLTIYYGRMNILRWKCF